MILTVTLNASIDKRYVVSDVKPGEVNRVSECVYSPGGKGINVARVASIYGERTAATGFLGGHAGEYIAEGLAPFKIKDEFFRIKGESRSCINIWDEQNHIQTELLEPGPVVSADDFFWFMENFTSVAKDADVISISGSAPKGLTADAYKEIIGVCKSLGKKVILDTSGKLLTDSIEALPDMIKPNIDEIRALTGKSCNDISEIVEAAHVLHDKGIPVVVVSLGADGSVVFSNEGAYRAVVPKIDAVNTVGCGDSMTAGFAIGFSKGWSMAETLKLASAISAAAALREETGYFLMEDMKRIIGDIKIEELGG